MNFIERKLLTSWINNWGKDNKLMVLNLPPWLHNLLQVVINVATVYFSVKNPGYLPLIMSAGAALGLTIQNSGNRMVPPAK